MYPYSSRAVLFVDGYNIIGSWSCLKETCKAAGLEAARSELIETLISYSAIKSYDTQIIFDAHYQKTPASRELINEFLSVYYTDFEQTADTHIEKLCASLRSEYNQSMARRVIVATSDRAQQLTVQGYGAEWISAKQLCYEVETSVCIARKRYQPPKQSKGRFLANSIDDKARQKLAQLRMGLK